MTHAVHLIGPVSVGKNYTGQYLMKMNPRISRIVVGDLVKARLHNDKKFRDKYGPVIARGDLVPDHEIIPMFVGAWEAWEGCILLTDGFFRTDEQIRKGRELGLLNSNALSLILKAKRATCRERNNHREMNGTDGKRTDGNSFGKRYKLFNDSLSNLERSLMQIWKQGGAHYEVINADSKLEAVSSEMSTIVNMFTHGSHGERLAPQTSFRTQARMALVNRAAACTAAVSPA